MGSSSSSTSGDNAHARTNVPRHSEPGALGEQSDRLRTIRQRRSRATNTAEQIEGDALQLLEGVKKGLAADSHPSNVLDQFTKLVLLDGSDKMSKFPQMVDAMGKQWTEILKHEGLLVPHLPGGQDDFNKLKSLRTDYFSLLLETKEVIAGLVEESSMKKEAIAAIFKAVESTRSRKAHKLSESDQLLFTESLRSLLNWVDESELMELREDWREMVERMEAEMNMFNRLAAEMKRKMGWKKRNPFTKVCAGLAAAIVLAGGVVLIVGSVFAGGLTWLPGAVMTTVGVTVLACLASNQSQEVLNAVKEISEMLDNYVENGKLLMKKVGDLKDVARPIKKSAAENIRLETTHLDRIEPCLHKLDEHLSKYESQGREAIRVVDKACVEFIKRKR